MTRHTPHGSIQNAVQRAYKQAGGVVDAADFLGLSVSIVSYGTELKECRPGGIGVNYLERLAKWKPSCARPIAQHFAALAGGVFQPVALDNVIDLHDHAGRTAKEYSEALQSMIRFAQDPSSKHLAMSDREIDECVEFLLTHKAAQRAQGGVK